MRNVPSEPVNFIQKSGFTYRFQTFAFWIIVYYICDQSFFASVFNIWLLANESKKRTFLFPSSFTTIIPKPQNTFRAKSSGLFSGPEYLFG